MATATRWRRPGGDERRRVFVLALGAALLGAAAPGCSPNAASGGLRTEPGVELKQNERTEERSREQAKSVGRRSLKTSQQYELPFTARANPFEPPASDAETRRTDSTTVAASDVRLVGVMSDDHGRMAAVEVSGEQRLARPGQQLNSKDGATGLYIKEIRVSEIVVEQYGRRWIVSLPRPGGLPAVESLPQTND